ncbi:MAG: low affinity iron permease family protein [Bacteroidetes bacterium]|nr:low affinity iron permease family protein [Bacteroidota bacterium]
MPVKRKEDKDKIPVKKAKPKEKKVTTFEKVAGKITQFSGSSYAFVTAVVLVLAWVVTGPIFDYSETWQLVINTGTTIITFLMVFIIQHSQNKDTLALQLKLNELIIAVSGASNELVDVEDLREDDLKTLRAHYEKVSVSPMNKNSNLLKKKRKTNSKN